MYYYCKEHFGKIDLTYKITCLFCLLGQETDFKTPLKVFTKDEQDEMNLQFYNKDIHSAAFVLPEFARKVGFQFYHKNFFCGTSLQSLSAEYTEHLHNIALLNFPIK